MAGPVQGPAPGSGPGPERYFGFAGGTDKNYPASALAGTGYVNMIRNGSFESWSQGTGMGAVRPDAWETNSTGLFGRDTTRHWGQYACKIQKKSTDGAVSQIYQTIKPFPTMAAAYQEGGKIFSWSIWAKTDEGAGTMTPYVYDGTNYTYGKSYGGSGDWEELRQSVIFDTSATDFKVGIEVAETASAVYVDYWTDCAYLCWGRANPQWSENPLDRGVICQDWDEDGTYTPVRGAMRVIPYEISGTLTGGASQEAVTYTLKYGCRQVVHATANLYAFGGNQRYVQQVRANNYTTTGFDILFTMVAGSLGADSYTVTGVVYAIGWDDPTEQFK